jgi:hypothetical protein
MAKKKKSAQEEEAISDYKEFLADLVGTIKDTMAKTKPLVDEKIFNAMWRGGLSRRKQQRKKVMSAKKFKTYLQNQDPKCLISFARTLKKDYLENLFGNQIFSRTF